jgi:hypothetical protein
MDNDCDGRVDEGNPGGDVPCNTGAPGVCSQGLTVCRRGTLRCQPLSNPTTEACNGLDDDCDGASDEGNPQGGRPCMTGEPGACGVGRTACEAGALVCRPEVTPTPEVCNRRDDNCDGRVDE